MDAAVLCPYCGEPIDLFIDEGGGGAQRYVEDCPVCCRPCEVSVEAGEEGEPAVSIHRADE